MAKVTVLVIEDADDDLIQQLISLAQAGNIQTEEKKKVSYETKQPKKDLRKVKRGSVLIKGRNVYSPKGKNTGWKEVIEYHRKGGRGFFFEMKKDGIAAAIFQSETVHLLHSWVPREPSLDVQVFRTTKHAAVPLDDFMKVFTREELEQYNPHYPECTTRMSPAMPRVIWLLTERRYSPVFKAGLVVEEATSDWLATHQEIVDEINQLRLEWEAQEATPEESPFAD